MENINRKFNESDYRTMEKKTQAELVNASTLGIEYALPQTSKVKITEGQTVFVGCVPGNITEREFIYELNLHGIVRNLRIKKKYKKKGGMGFAILDILDPEIFKDFTIEGRKQIYLRGRKIPTRQYFSEKKKKSCIDEVLARRVYLRNIPLEMSDQEISAIFEKFGNLHSAYAIRKDGNVSKGFGYANFSEVRGAKNVIKRGRVPVMVAGEKLYIECEAYSKHGNSVKSTSKGESNKSESSFGDALSSTLMTSTDGGQSVASIKELDARGISLTDKDEAVGLNQRISEPSADSLILKPKKLKKLKLNLGREGKGNLTNGLSRSNIKISHKSTADSLMEKVELMKKYKASAKHKGGVLVTGKSSEDLSNYMNPVLKSDLKRLQKKAVTDETLQQKVQRMKQLKTAQNFDKEQRIKNQGIVKKTQNEPSLIKEPESEYHLSQQPSLKPIQQKSTQSQNQIIQKERQLIRLAESRQPRLDFSLDPEDHDLKSRYIANPRILKLVDSNLKLSGNINFKWDNDIKKHQIMTTVGNDFIELEKLKNLRKKLDALRSFYFVGRREDPRGNIGKMMMALFLELGNVKGDLLF